MANKSNCSIYGPDLAVHESQGKEIADTGLRIMRGVGAIGKEEGASGPDTSKNGLEKLK